jgi:uncharacterized protein (TIGR03437 family)
MMMQKQIRTASLLAIFIAGTVSGQTVVGSRYQDLTLSLAPGQVVPLLVTGLQTVLSSGSAKAHNITVPTALAGISVTLTQPPTSYSRSLPIFSIDQFNHCSATMAPAADCLLTAITVEIPFDIAVPNPLQVSPCNDQPGTVVTIFENENVSKAFVLSPLPDRIHVLQSCDIDGQTFGTGVCYPIVTHADGTLVLQDARGPGQVPLTNTEALPGEVITMYAYGLGVVSPAVQAGSASPNPAATVTAAVNLQFDYRPNASPSTPTLNSSTTSTAQPIFAGLTPGEVGLYQINFTVPTPPPGTPVCGAPVESNLTISVVASGQSFSGAAICVDTSSK